MAENESGPKFDIGSLMRRKVAGVPVSILVLLVAGVLLYMAFRMPSGSDDSEEVGEEADDYPTGDADTPGSNVPIFLAKPAPMPSTGGDVIATPDEPTDAEWAREAITWLIGEGESPQMASNAINAYLQGEALSQSQGVLRDKVLVKFGSPPESGFLPTKTNSYKGPSVKQGNAPTTHTVKGKNDDQWRELARIYYSRDDANSARLIKSANPSLDRRHGNRLPVGTSVLIPAYTTPKYFAATKEADGAGEIARRNGTTARQIKILNPGMDFPVRTGRRVRVQ